MIFIDTGAIVGRYFQRDQYHSAAVRIWDELTRSREHFITSNFVLDEAFTILARRAGYAFAADKARRIYQSRVVLILRPSEDHEILALDFLEKYADQEVNFTDCVSFALMRTHGIDRAFTFDRHFRLAGFKAVPALT
ncbi:MAG TPA: PIN domain-containing protein [Thermoanaerobaculia bacterium]